jgi:hypothetical protein
MSTFYLVRMNHAGYLSFYSSHEFHNALEIILAPLRRPRDLVMSGVEIIEDFMACPLTP